ncbi:hypothetical protein [uncultured Neptuniibacter sp.]|uniref:hypothetical protein n=1 Tax=uncultured Neptuniibacter sp. TaxID=502143 RepID=UPI0032B219A6|tara:strand:+ start:8395 stop:8622 length:228 start_codon:yes stop_codon:yes gene_type:complete
MDAMNTAFAKAVDYLSSIIFIPALICAVFVELGPFVQSQFGLGLLPTYLIALCVGAVLVLVILFLISEIGIRLLV